MNENEEQKNSLEISNIKDKTIDSTRIFFNNDNYNNNNIQLRFNSQN
jgi:hypothetical protein